MNESAFVSDKQPLNLDLMGLPFTELIQMAARALKEGDLMAVDQANQALHFHFVQHLRKRKQAERKPFLSALFELADAREVRKLDVEELTRTAIRWDHMFHIMHSLDMPESLEAAAREFVESREYGWDLLRIVAEAEEMNERLAVGELAKRLGRSDSTVVQVLGKMEARGLIERHREGQHVFVLLGSIGIVLMETKGPVLIAKKPIRADYRNASPTLVGLMSAQA